MVDVLFLRVTFAELIIIAVYVSAMAILVAIDSESKHISYVLGSHSLTLTSVRESRL